SSLDSPVRLVYAITHSVNEPPEPPCATRPGRVEARRANGPSSTEPRPRVRSAATRPRPAGDRRAGLAGLHANSAPALFAGGGGRGCPRAHHSHPAGQAGPQPRPRPRTVG